MRKIIGFFLVILILASLDQASKYYIINHISQGEITSVFSKMGLGLNLVLTHNMGVAFGMFSKASSRWILASLVALISIILFVWLIRLVKSNQEKLSQLSLVLILGGALGNLYDRIFRGYVVDFIDVYFNNYHWYTFNLADCFVTIGAIILIINLLFFVKEEN